MPRDASCEGPDTEADPVSPSPRHQDLEAARARASLRNKLFGGVEPGASAGRYSLGSKLGQGGMGAVYRARDRTLERDVALKILHRGYSDDDVQRRLRREAQVLAALSHPNIVEVFEVGTATFSEGFPQLYIAMELVEGPTLRRWQPGRTVDEIVQMYLRVGEGLAAAHRGGVVHRDFKPDNVLVGAGDRPRVVDFGLAAGTLEEPAVVSVDASDQIGRITRTGAIQGTPAYMSPEQFAAMKTDARTDQWSFCVALYEALYGARPFTANTAPKLAQRVLEDDRDPVPEGTRVPPEIRDVVLRGIRTDRDERFGSMDALLTQLRAAGRQRRRRARRLLVAAGAVTMLGAAGAVFVVGAPRGRCPAPPDVMAGAWDAEARAALQAHDPDHAAQLSSLLDRYIEQWREAHDAACRDPSDARFSCLDRHRHALASLAGALATSDDPTEGVSAAASLPRPAACLEPDVEATPVPYDPDVAGEAEAIRLLLADVRASWATGQPKRAVSVALDAAKRADALGYLPVVAEAWGELGVSYGHDGQFEAARDALERAYAVAVEARHDGLAARIAGALVGTLGRDLRQHADAAHWAKRAETMGGEGRYAADVYLGRRAHLGGDVEEGRRRLLRAREWALAHDGPDSTRAAATLLELAVLEGAQGNYDRAVELARDALRTAAAALGPRHPQVARVRQGLGLFTMRQGDFDTAEAELAEAAAIQRETLGPDHPSLLSTLEVRGAVAGHRGDYEQARKIFTEVLEARRRRLGPSHDKVAQTRGNLAQVLIHLGEYEAAHHHLEAALAAKQELYGSDNPELANVLQLLAEIQMKLGNHEAAIEEQQRALDLLARAGRDTRIDRAKTMINIAKSLADLGRLDDAIAAAAEGVRLGTKDGKLNSQCLTGRANLGMYLVDAGRVEEGVETLRKSAAETEATLGPDAGVLGRVLVELARALAKTGRSSAALDPATRGLDVLQRAGFSAADLADARTVVAQAYWDLGQPRRARETIEEAVALLDPDAADEVAEHERLRAWLDDHPEPGVAAR